jgi:hypothetical protein
MISETDSIKSLFSLSRILEALITSRNVPGSLYSIAHTPMISDAGTTNPYAYLFDDLTVALFDDGSEVTYA